MALRIEAIASYCGLKGIFKLLAADIYEVLSVEAVAEERGAGRPATARRPACALDPVFTMKALQDLSTRIHRADSLETAARFDPRRPRRDLRLQALDDPGAGRANAGVLVTIASRGYPENGAGAEARFGEGIIGMVAEARKPIRISGLMRGRCSTRYAVQKRAQSTGCVAVERRFRCPGLRNPESQLGVPLLVRGELVGVLCIESEMPYRFHEEDKTTIELLGSYLAIAIQNMQLQERSPRCRRRCRAETPSARRPQPRPPSPAAAPSVPSRHEVAYYTARRVHPGGRRVPDPQPAGADPVEAAAPRARARDARSSPIASCGSTSR